MKRLGPIAEEAIAKAERHREWHWCRHWNGFSDQPRWRLIAARLGMPAHQVIAFVHRLDEFANAAGNIGHARGHVGHFNAAEFGAALGMPEEDAAHIYAALADAEIGWIASEHVATFWDRNRDREDDGAKTRKRRQRRREGILKALAKLSRLGRIEDARRSKIETALMDLSDEELTMVENDLAVLQLSTGHGVTRDGRRDAVTVTPEKRRDLASRPVDNFGGNARGSAAGLSDQEPGGEVLDPQEVAALWMARDGRQIVIDRMELKPGDAETRIERWLRDLDHDAAALAEIIRGAEAVGYMGAPFHNLIVDGIRRHKIGSRPQRSLPLRMPLKDIGHG